MFDFKNRLRINDVFYSNVLVHPVALIDGQQRGILGYSIARTYIMLWGSRR